MDSILRGLYNGKIIPWERRPPRNEAIAEIVRKIENEERYFMEKMSLDDCQRFQALANLHTQLTSADEDNIFAYGFTLGMLMAADVMKEAETINDD